MGYRRGGRPAYDDATEYSDDCTDYDDDRSTAYTAATSDYSDATSYRSRSRRAPRGGRAWERAGPPPPMPMRPPQHMMPPPRSYGPGPGPSPRFFPPVEAPPPPLPPPPPTPQPSKPPKAKPPPRPRRPISATDRVRWWKWATSATAAIAGFLFIAVWFFNEIAVVHLPGTSSGAAKADIAVQIHGSSVFNLGAMPNTPAYTLFASAGFATAMQLFVVVGGALGIIAGVFKLSGSKGRVCASDCIGSLQCWSYSHEVPPLGCLHWRVWWMGATSSPAILICTLFVYVWSTTSSAATQYLKNPAGLGKSTIFAGLAALLLVVASGLSAHHAILFSRLNEEDSFYDRRTMNKSGKASWRHDGSDTVSTLPPYEPPQPEPKSFYTGSHHHAPPASASYGCRGPGPPPCMPPPWAQPMWR